VFLWSSGRLKAKPKKNVKRFSNSSNAEVGVALLGRMLGNFDLATYPLDGPLPALPLTESGQPSRQKRLTEKLAGQEKPVGATQPNGSKHPRHRIDA
jgi:hypothetical protein